MESCWELAEMTTPQIREYMQQSGMAFFPDDQREDLIYYCTGGKQNPSQSDIQRSEQWSSRDLNKVPFAEFPEIVQNKLIEFAQWVDDNPDAQQKRVQEFLKEDGEEFAWCIVGKHINSADHTPVVKTMSMSQGYDEKRDRVFRRGDIPL